MNIINILQRFICTGAIIGGLLASGIVAGPALAAPIPPGGDSHQRGCRALQTDAERLVEEYGRPGTTNQRRAEILEDLRNIGRDWRDTGCRARFGDIALTPPRPGFPPKPTVPVPGPLAPPPPAR